MKVQSIIYLVEDAFGQRSFASCEDSCDTIQICGMQNSEGENKTFESDAYHLQEWCRVNGFKYKCILKEYDFNELWDQKKQRNDNQMKYLKLLFVVLLFSACSSSNECKLDLKTPDYFIGNWWESETTFDRITKDDIVNVNRTSSGSFTIGLCENLSQGDGSGELTPIIDTDEYFTFRIDYDNGNVTHRTYFQLTGDTIGRCDDTYPCQTFKKLWRR
jgi:hypothetical protein